ncbi:MAG: flagellar basal-body MS-ring/collar protein FliF [Mariprofundus sp.]|nr:flagellar basal-body MS-ring/collar protein FliF [Mariprofundus sp.]
MPNALTPRNQMGINPAPLEPGAQGDVPSGGNIHVPQVLAKYRRIMLFAAASLMLAGFIGLVLWSSEKPYRAVYAGMAEKDAATVVEMLQKEHIPYRLEGGGTVMVPENQVYQVRMKLAGQGVTPGASTGFEIFDQSNEFGLSDFTRKINLQRAMQGELARTIEVMPQVSAARIQLVLPKESAFADRDRKATASVMLQISGAQRLPKNTVLAIQNLVAASVPQLSIADVTVVDASGTLLSTNDKESASSEGQTLQEFQSALEQRMEQRITGMLEQIVGPGQAVIRVSADIDREFIDQQSTRYNPDEQVLRSRKSIQESHSTASGAAIGVPGLASNTPGGNPATNATPSEPKDKASRSEDVNNYEISSTSEHRVVPFGNIKKLSVAAIIGGHTQTDDKGVVTFTPRSGAELINIQKLVEQAMGFNEDRGDSVSVQSMPLVDISSRADSSMLDDAEDRAYYLVLARYGMAALALLLLAWFVLKPLAKRIQSSDEEEQLKNGQSALSPQNQMSDAAYARLANMEQVKQSIHQEPERANKVLREWVDPA